jgi:hypothetical protein
LVVQLSASGCYTLRVANLIRSFAACLATLAGMLAVPVFAEDDIKLAHAKFTGEPSCSSSSCHGGGTGRNEAVIYGRKDRHAVAHGILAKGTSLRIAEALGIVGDPTKSAQCNVCHAPMQGVSPDRLVQGASADRGVSCESCHGPAENWLRFHTRPDVNFQQIVSAGLRDMNDIYGRANVCVACHLNLDEPIRKAGHPELHFELDGQAMAQPPHYIDARPSLGPRSWLTGQAAALRELSWKLAAKREESLAARWKALVWLLRKTEPGRQGLPETQDFATMQTAADNLARQAAGATWTKDEVTKLLKSYISVRAEFSAPKSNKAELQRRAEVLVPAIDRLWRALKKESDLDATAFEPALDAANLLSHDREDFEPTRFAAALQELELAFGRVTSPSTAAPKPGKAGS